MPPRIECPACHTSYTLAHLHLPGNPGNKAYIACVCTQMLQVDFVIEEVPGTQGWWDWALRRQAPATKRVVPIVGIADE